MRTPAIPGLEKWIAWGRGEEHGRLDQQLRGLEVPAERLDQLRALRHPWPRVDLLLEAAATATSFEEWWSLAPKG